MILLYLESFGNPRKFARVAGRVARSKPILAMRSGTSRAGARAASSHTAALASSDDAVDALFWQAGVLRSATLEELLDAAVLFSTQPLPRGNRVAVADECRRPRHPLRRRLRGRRSDAAAPRRRDASARCSRSIPAEASVSNPVDLLGSATAATYEATLPLLLADPGIDAVIALFVPPVVATAADVAETIARASESAGQAGAPGRDERRRHRGRRLRISRVRCARARARRTASGLAAPARRRSAPTLDRIDRSAAAAHLIADALAASDDVWLDPAAVRALLSSYGLPLVEERYAATPGRRARCGGRDRLPRGRQDGRSRRAQDRVGRCPSRLAGRRERVTCAPCRSVRR